ncbi:MAG: hypothetical protein ABJL57_06955 [Hyphomonas sp.]|uniref:hypothetical protein n=1 Tax=Hyphomonas sp. TaxID=87 RepID=UPI003264DD0C
MKSIWKAIGNEFQRAPVGTLGAIAAVLALFISNPEILNVANTATTETDPTVRNSAGLVTWILLYLAVCYLFAKWTSVVIRGKYSTGILILPVFSIVAITIGTYLASIYLGGYPLYEKVGENGDKSHVWIGMYSPFFALMVSSIWALMVAGMLVPEAISHDEQHNSDETASFSLVFIMAVILLSGAVLSHALMFGLVETVPVEAPTNGAAAILGPFPLSKLVGANWTS